MLFLNMRLEVLWNNYKGSSEVVPGRILKLDDHLHIDNFRKVMTEAQKDPTYNKFIRKGKVGDWRNHFTEEKNKIWNQWIAKNLKEAGIDSIQFD